MIKAGTTCKLKMQFGTYAIDTIDLIIISIKSENGTLIKKDYPGDITYSASDNSLLVPLTQEDTLALAKNGVITKLRYEAQINFKNKSVIKSNIMETRIDGDTLHTFNIEGNAPYDQLEEFALNMSTVNSETLNATAIIFNDYISTYTATFDEKKASATTAANTATAAATTATNAATNATTAANTATTAKNSATESASIARSYAVGDTSYRAGEATDNAKYYYEQARAVTNSIVGALIPMGTISFANLPTITSNMVGFMYNISDEFTANSLFKDNTDQKYPAGTNVYVTADLKWDCLSSPGTIIDDTLSTVSENPIQNRTITTAINEIKALENTSVISDTASTIEITTNNKLLSIDKLGGLSKKSKNLLVTNLTTATTANGITVTPLGDGTFNVNGTASANCQFEVKERGVISELTKLIGCPVGGSYNTYNIVVVNYSGSDIRDIGNGATIPQNTECAIRMYIESGTVCNNLIFKPMITTDTTLTYADYMEANTIDSNPIVDVKSENNAFDGEWLQGYRTYTDGKMTVTNTDYHITCKNPISCSGGDMVEIVADRECVGIVICTDTNNYKAVSNADRLSYTIPYGVTKFAFYISSSQAKGTISPSNAPNIKVATNTDHYTIPKECAEDLIANGYGMGFDDVVNNYIEFGKTYHNMKSIDLSSLNWTYDNGWQAWSTVFTDMKTIPSRNDLLSAICDNYSVYSLNALTTYFHKGIAGLTETSTNKFFIAVNNGSTTEKPSGILHYEANDNSGQDYTPIIYHKKVDEVDLSTLSFNYAENYSAWGLLSPYLKAKPNAKLLAEKYRYTADITAAANMEDNSSIVTASRTIWVKNGSSTETPSGKLQYELAIEEIYDVTDLLQSNNILECEKNGTISFIDSSGVTKNVPYKVTFLGTSDATVKLNHILKGNEKEDINDSIIIDAWNSLKTYAVGEYCISGDKLWKCKVQNVNTIPTEGSNWTCVSICEELTASDKMPITWDNTSNYAVCSSHVNYTNYIVKNGVCYVNISVYCNSPSADNVYVFSGLPKPKCGFVFAALCANNETENGTMFAGVRDNGSLALKRGIAKVNYMGSFSYPVV